MKILGIETSCDETAAAIVENGTTMLSSIISSSLQLHVKTGGIIPEVASREQVKFIIPVIERAIKNSGLKIKNLDAVAVTVGPGLIGSLLVGVETAKTLAYVWQKPIVPVNHLVGHIYANWLANQNKVILLAIVLLASGGHTDLLLMKDHGKFQWLGGTRDDAAGEAFDKIARLLGLSYPGGPSIAAAAEKLKIENLKLKIKLPRPMIEKDNFDFSFSGLKTAVLREVNNLKTMGQFNHSTIQHLAFETQEAITDVLVEKTIRAAEKYKVNSILLGGGVTANQCLRDKFTLKIENLKLKIKLFVPLKSLCTDNAAVIASAAYFSYQPVSWEKISPDPGLHF